MLYIFCFILSILLNTCTDNIILHHLQCYYSGTFISFFAYVCSFIVIFSWKRSIAINFFNIGRAFLCSIAFLLTFQAYKRPGISTIDVTSMYYMIPIFESIVFIVLFKRYTVRSFVYIFFNIVCSYMFCSKNVPLIGAIGCLLFAISDILISNSKSKDSLIDILSFSFFSAIFFLLIGLITERSRFLHYSLKNKFLWFVALIIVFSDILIFYSYKNESPVKLSPFRYIDLLFLNIYKDLFNKSIKLKSLIPAIFIIVRLFI